MVKRLEEVVERLTVGAETGLRFGIDVPEPKLIMIGCSLVKGVLGGDVKMSQVVGPVVVMRECQVIGLLIPESDLCINCKGSGSEPRMELCQNCDRCFDEEIGWSTGIEPGAKSQAAARELVRLGRAQNGG